MAITIVVAGAGPAGLMAALRAAEKGAKVVVLEKMEKPARKLRISGKGRCNITNIKPEEEFLQNIFPDSRFFKPAFKNFSNYDLVDFLNNIGLETVEERGGRVFPASQKAWDVADALVREVQKKCTVECHAEVCGLELSGDRLTGLYYEQYGRKTKLALDALIVATGGVSYPLTGSTGDGYELARQTGHETVLPRPSLTGLELADYKEIKGAELKNVELSLLIDGGVVRKEFGEMEFTEYGIDGPIVLKISRLAVDAILAKKKTEIQINFKPALSNKQLINRIEREIAASADRQLAGLLKTLLPVSLINTVIEKTAVSAKKSLKDINATEINRLISTLTGLKFRVSGFRPFSEAIVTAGGVSLKNVNSKTMCSKQVKNLFFAGEVLDLDANTGGYNLQIAFSTGYLAGEKAAEICRLS